MRRRCAALEAVDVKISLQWRVDLLPFQVRHFRCPQTVPVGHEHHERISTAVPVAARASISRSISSAAGVLARAGLRFLGGVGGRFATVPFLVAGGTSWRFGFAMINRLPAMASFPYRTEMGQCIKAGPARHIDSKRRMGRCLRRAGHQFCSVGWHRTWYLNGVFQNDTFNRRPPWWSLASGRVCVGQFAGQTGCKCKQVRRDRMIRGPAKWKGK